MEEKTQFAFPFSIEESDGGHEYTTQFTGMTLRDYFAAKAMQSTLSNQDLITSCNQLGEKNNLTNSEALSLFSYQIADAMLKQRDL